MSLRKIFASIFIITLLLGLFGCRAFVFERSVRNEVYLEGRHMGGLKESDALRKIEAHASSFDTPPIDAKINEANWEVSQERSGKKINTKKTLQILLNSEKGQNVRPVVEEVKPAVNSDMLKKNITVIGSCTTPILDDRDSRLNNIEIASAEISNAKLAPGAEFSFNKTVGKRTRNKGYEEAPIIVKTPDGFKKKNGLGGGICQISTTLYNAVEAAHLEVTERHLHSKDIGYVAKGKDATVSYGSVDFKFKNNKGYPIMIKVFLADQELTVKILENRNEMPKTKANGA